MWYLSGKENSSILWPRWTNVIRQRQLVLNLWNKQTASVTLKLRPTASLLFRTESYHPSRDRFPLPFVFLDEHWQGKYDVALCAYPFTMGVVANFKAPTRHTTKQLIHILWMHVILYLIHRALSYILNKGLSLDRTMGTDLTVFVSYINMEAHVLSLYTSSHF